MDESRIVTREVEVNWGGERRTLPVLAMGPADDWRKLFQKKFPENDTTVMDGAKAMTMTGDKLVALMLAYDGNKVLGTREWIRANVTDDELADAFVEVFRRTFRLGRLPLELTQAALRPQPAKSPNGRSPIGTLTPISSASDSATNS
jgi:hypothetical protein